MTLETPRVNHPGEPLLHAVGLTKIYKKRTVVNQVTIEVCPGEIVGILGKNGAGKTTTFKMIVGLIQPNEGRVNFQGRDVTHLPMYLRARQGLGYLDQKSSIFQDLTVDQNVSAILEAMGISRKERRRRTDKVLTELKITHVRNNKAGSLSGGERRRLEISRVLATNPELIMLDEPFAAIDPIARDDLKTIIGSLKELKIAILITDHNAEDTLSITDRAYIFADPEDPDRAGTVITSGSPEELVADPVARKNYLGEKFVLKPKEEEFAPREATSTPEETQ